MDKGIQRRFAITGVAGFVAPRHLAAMKSLGCELVMAHDVTDSVGILDRYFPHTRFTTSHADLSDALASRQVDTLTVCTPNHLHCPYTIEALKAGVDVVCEKPLALTTDELRRMDEARKAAGCHVWPILQLRLHPAIIKTRQMVEDDDAGIIHDVDLAYITPRGRWYAASWKGNPAKSGGLAANIGIHFIDMLQWIFGPARHIAVNISRPDCVAGRIELGRARVRFFLSVNPKHAEMCGAEPMTAYRHMTIDGNEFDFSAGFTELHTLSYRHILDGNGFSIADTRPAVEAIEIMRHATPTGMTGDYHPMLKQITL